MRDIDDLPTCEHDFSERQVRISCHEDITSQECQSQAMFSAWCCGRPACKAMAMRAVKAVTGFEPVTVKRKAAAA